MFARWLYRFSPKHRRIQRVVKEFVRLKDMHERCPRFTENASTWEFYLAVLVAILFGHIRSGNDEEQRTAEALQALEFLSTVLFVMVIKNRGEGAPNSLGQHPEYKPFLASMRDAVWERAEHYVPYLDPTAEPVPALVELAKVCETYIVTKKPFHDEQVGFFRLNLPLELRITHAEAIMEFRSRLDRNLIP
jgi:hypothetical protein